MRASARITLGLTCWLLLPGCDKGSPTGPRDDQPPLSKKEAGPPQRVEIVPGRPREAALFQDLDAYLQSQKPTDARSRFLRGHFDMALDRAKVIYGQAEDAAARTVLDDLALWAREMRTLAGLAFDGYRLDQPRRRVAVPFQHVTSWLKRAGDRVLIRRPSLVEDLRSGKLTDPDLFYLAGYDEPPSGYVAIPSLAQLTGRLPNEQRYAVQAADFVRDNSLSGQDKLLALRETEITAMTEEEARAEPKDRPLLALVRKYRVDALRSYREAADMQRSPIKTLDLLYDDFLKRSTESFPPQAVAEWERSLSAIREFRQFVALERAMGVIGDDNNMKFFVFGGKAAREFDQAMRGQGIAVTKGMVTAFSPLTAAPPRTEVGRPRGDGSIPILGLKSLETLGR